MTTERLRELMEERVAEVSVVDTSPQAWTRAVGVRRRRRIALVGTAAAVVLVAAGTVAVLDDRTPTNSRPSGQPTPAPPASGEPARAELSGEFRGAGFWWAPAADTDPLLPVLQVPHLPDRLSMADEEPVAIPPQRVDAVFGTGKQHYRLLSGGELVSVDLSGRLGPVADEGGNEFNPLGLQSVSPDGTQVAFRQPGRVEVWDLPSNTWRTVPTADYERVGWTRAGELWLPGEGGTGRPDPWTGPGHQYSQVVTGPGGAAELDWLGRTFVPGSDEYHPGRTANPEFLAAGPADDLSVLAVGVSGRSKLCCSLLGWFSHDFVLFATASPDGTYRVLAWRVGTPDIYRVSQFVDVPRPFAVTSWAEDALTGYGQ